MTKTVADFEAYCAMDPVTRMQARLQGLAEVLSASGLKILPGTARDKAVQGASFNPAAGQQQAFNEAGAGFDAQLPGSAEPTSVDDLIDPLAGPSDKMRLPVGVAFSDNEVTALAETLGIPREKVLAALADIKRQ